MAIPFYLPTDEQTEDDYRRLDQLLHDLYQVLRQILLRPASASVRHQEDRNAGPEAPAPRRPRRDLPDLVPTGAPAPAPAPGPACPCARHGHRRRRRPCCAPQAPARPPAAATAPPIAALDHWLVIGEQLRKIVEEFKSTKKPEEPSERPARGAEGTEASQSPGLKLEVRSQGLFSLLMPLHSLPSPIWTTVILLVGWRLLAVRSR